MNTEPSSGQIDMKEGDCVVVVRKDSTIVEFYLVGGGLDALHPSRLRELAGSIEQVAAKLREVATTKDPAA